MKCSIILLTISLLFTSFYCEGMAGLLETFNSFREPVTCIGDVISIENADPPCEIIHDNITIISTDLRSLRMYSAIEEVYGSIIIERNSVLNNLNGLSQIIYIEGEFIINDNNAITETEVKRIINKILNNNEGYIGGNIIYNEVIVDLKNFITADI